MNCNSLLLTVVLGTALFPLSQASEGKRLHHFNNTTPSSSSSPSTPNCGSQLSYCTYTGACCPNNYVCGPGACCPSDIPVTCPGNYWFVFSFE